MQGLQQVTTWWTTKFNCWCSNIEWLQIQCDENLGMKGKAKSFLVQTQCDESLGVKGKKEKAIASNAMWWKLGSDRKNKKAITTNVTQRKSKTLERKVMGRWQKKNFKP